MAKKQLQEMDVAAGTKQSKTAVNANAKPAMPMDTSMAGSVEDLGGPTPMNYKPDDDSAKLKTPGGTLKQVKDVVNSKPVGEIVVAFSPQFSKPHVSLPHPDS